MLYIFVNISLSLSRQASADALEDAAGALRAARAPLLNMIYS